MKLRSPPPPTYSFGYRNPPRSGNEINGLGVTEKVRAHRVFHNSVGLPAIEWGALDQFQKAINSFGAVWQVILSRWDLRRAEGAVARVQVPVDDPAAMSERIKDQAKRSGAGLVGIADVTDDDFYIDRPSKYRFAVCLAMPMDWDVMQDVPNEATGVEVMRVYRKVQKVSVRLAEYIRALGWPAKAYGDSRCSDVLQIPLAIRAGIGELGKHGSMICREYGSNFRLASVLTDMPLIPDRPIDIGVDDLCLGCQRCVQDCPPGAILNEKAIVRGTRKWYVDFDKCAPYFTKTYGCAICLEVCPWSEPGRGPALSQKLLEKRVARSGTHAADRPALTPDLKAHRALPLTIDA